MSSYFEFRVDVTELKIFFRRSSSSKMSPTYNKYWYQVVYKDCINIESCITCASLRHNIEVFFKSNKIVHSIEVQLILMSEPPQTLKFFLEISLTSVLNVP